MTAYTVINGTDSQLSSVDGSGTNVDAHTYKDGITLDSTHVVSALTTAGVAVVKDLTGVADATQKKRIIAIAGLKAST